MSVISTSDLKPSVCPLDCPDTCSLSVEVANGEVAKVRGSTANPYTDGVICNKVARSYPEFVHGSNRLTHPLRRTGPRGSGAYEVISWQEAIKTIHLRFSEVIEKFGPQSVMPFNYAGPHGELSGGSMDRRFFHKLGATLLDRGPLCGAVRGTAYSSLYGEAPGMPPEQARESDLIVIWGNNVTVSNVHFAAIIKDAKKAGARIVVIDPKRTKIAEQSDLFLQVLPGADVVLAMAAAAELEKQDAFDTDFIARWTVGFDQYMAQARSYSVEDVEALCGLKSEQFFAFVELYKSAKNVAVSIGNGIERGRSGGSGLRAAMALQALTGNHGRSGAGVLAKPGLAAPKTRQKLQRPDLVPAGTRTFNIVDVAEKLLNRSLSPPVKAIFIYNHNPIATHPHQSQLIKALELDDLFIAGSDIAMTDSMRYADIILPAASHFEHHDVYCAYGQNYVQRAEPIIPLVGESLPNTEIFRRLANRFGFDDELFTATDMQLIDSALDGDDPRMGGVRPSEIPLSRAMEMKALNSTPPVMCSSVSPATKSGKIELFSEDLEQRFGYGVPRYEAVAKNYPFTLISPSSSKRINATFGGCGESDGLEILEISQHDATASGIVSGSRVRAWNALGEVILTAVVSDAVRPGVVYSPKGTWLSSSPTRQTVNTLIPSDIRADIERGACYNETFVDISPVSS